MRRSLDVSLWEVKKQSGIILELTAGRTLAEYCSNQLLRYAAERVFTKLGEALVRVRKHFPAEFDRLIDAAPIVTFRNQLIHSYDLTRDEDVWDIATISLPLLIAQLDTMLGEQQP